ncbi:MAG: hypothetical protein KIS92_02660 [Planctomycetota bacterium]|nr:hypothetical protein [Planctomycetota bacterium]
MSTWYVLLARMGKGPGRPLNVFPDAEAARCNAIEWRDLIHPEMRLEVAPFEMPESGEPVEVPEISVPQFRPCENPMCSIILPVQSPHDHCSECRKSLHHG